MLVGQLMAGGSLSFTVTVKLHVAVLPAVSVTRNTFVVTPTGKADPLAIPPVCVVTAPPPFPTRRSSDLVTTALHRLASTLATMFDGQLITGGSLSVTVTVKLHAATLRARSVTRNTLVVTPTGKADPLANPPVCVVTAPAQLSVPTGAV